MVYSDLFFHASFLYLSEFHFHFHHITASDPEERLSIALELLSKEKEVAKLQREIAKQVEEKMAKSQREYFLKEQLKSIKKVIFYFKLNAFHNLLFSFYSMKYN